MEAAFLGFVAALSAIVLSLPLLRVASRNPAVGFLILALPWTLKEAIGLPQWSAAGLTIEPTKLAALLLLLAGLSRLIQRPNRTRVAIVATAASLFLTALLRGFASGQWDTLEFSNHLALLSGITYGMSFALNAHQRHDLYRALQGTALSLAAVFVAVEAGLLPGSGTSGSLGAGSALLIGHAFLARVLATGVSRPRQTFISIMASCVLSAVVLVAQHRTVWVVAIVGLAYVLVRLGRRIGSAVGMAVILLAVVFLLDAAGLRGARSEFATDRLATSLQQAAEDETTFEWRQQRWAATLASNADRGLLAVALGAGYGAPWVTSGPESLRTEPPHNQYIELAVRFGLVGVVLWIVLFIATGVRLWRSRSTGRGTGVSNDTLLIIVSSFVIWSVAYSITGPHTVLLGLALGAAIESGDSPEDRKRHSLTRTKRPRRMRGLPHTVAGARPRKLGGDTTGLDARGV